MLPFQLWFGVLAFTHITHAAVSSNTNITDSLPPLQQPRGQGSGILVAPLKRVDMSGLDKRQDISTLFNVKNGYFIQTSIGTPPQLVYVQLDTGSSDLWVDPNCSSSWTPVSCNNSPSYDPNVSTTAEDIGKPFNINYGTGSASGEYLLDNVQIGGATINLQQFGLTTRSEYAPVGILGIGLGYGWTLNYYNVIDQMYVQGITNSRAFSLDLASIDVYDGYAIFGGIDTMKYTGSLYKTPIIPYNQAPQYFPRYWIYLTSVGITQPGSVSSTVITPPKYEQGIFPDSGTTLSQFPPSLFNALIQFFPSAVDIGNGVYTVPCSLRNEPGTFEFGFGTKIIHVSYYEFIWNAGSKCYFGAVSNPTVFSLGDSFMRSAYLVYDQDNFNLHLAQAANCGTNILPIGSGPNAVPSITGCPDLLQTPMDNAATPDVPSYIPSSGSVAYSEMVGGPSTTSGTSSTSTTSSTTSTGPTSLPTSSPACSSISTSSQVSPTPTLGIAAFNRKSSSSRVSSSRFVTSTVAARLGSGDTSGRKG